MVHPLWPLFDLVIRSERLELRLPTDDELAELAAVARAGIHDPDDMPFDAPWSTLPSPAFERGFVQHHWAMRANWRPEDWWLNLGTFLDGRVIGSQSVIGHEFATSRAIRTGSWLGRPYQGQGLGKEMRSAVLAFAFDHLGAVAAHTDAFSDNMRSIGVSRSLGYADEGPSPVIRDGIERTKRRFRMTREVWQARPRPPIEATGLGACRELFGA